MSLVFLLLLLSGLSPLDCRYDYYNLNVPESEIRSQIIYIIVPLVAFILLVVITPSMVLALCAWRECRLARKRRPFPPAHQDTVPPTYSEIELTAVEEEPPPTYDTTQDSSDSEI